MSHPDAGAIKSKLAVKKAGDDYEQEADRIAQPVMRMPALQLQRACACGGGCPKCVPVGSEASNLHVSRRGDPAERVADRVAAQVLARGSDALHTAVIRGGGPSEPMSIYREDPPPSARPLGMEFPTSAVLHERGELQAKFTLSSQSDPAEREAERVADRVLRTNEAAMSKGMTPHVGLSTASTGGAGVLSDEQARRIEALGGAGRPLPESTRLFFESWLDRDLSDVRVHTGSAADEAARSIDAEAFTVGSDVAFARGTYRPTTERGTHLLAHELAHVAQQHGTRSEDYSRASRSGTNETMVIHRRVGVRGRARTRQPRSNQQHSRSHQIVQHAKRDHNQHLQRLRERSREQTRQQQARMYRISREKVDGLILTIRNDFGAREQPVRNPTQASATVTEWLAEEVEAMSVPPEHAICLDEQRETEAPGVEDPAMCMVIYQDESEALTEATAAIIVDNADPGIRAIRSLREATEFVRDAANQAAVSNPNAWRWYALVTVEDGLIVILAVSTWRDRLETAGWDDGVSVIYHEGLTETFRNTVSVIENVDVIEWGE